MAIARTMRWAFLGGLASLLLFAGADAAFAQDAAGGRRRGDRAGLRDRGARAERRAGRVARHRRARLLRTLDRIATASDEQVKAALEATREVSRIRAEARAKAAAVLVQAFRDGRDAAPDARARLRAATRERLRAIREECRGPLTLAGMKVVRALTPEQRKSLEDAAAARGRTLDEGRLALRCARRLASPWSEALLEARLGGR